MKHVNLGAKQFADRIRSKYFAVSPLKEIPQQRKLAKRSDPGEVFKQACILLDYDLQKYRTSQRIHGEDRQKRDLVAYILWETGSLTNEKRSHCHFIFNS